MTEAHNNRDLQFDTVIVGLGLTGLSCARYLASRTGSIAITDSREIPPQLAALRQEMPDIPLFLGDIKRELLCNAGRLVISPGVPIQAQPIQDAMSLGVPVTNDIELFCQHVSAPIAAITGSNGKSTVTTLLGMMAERAGFKAGVGGNLGTPALDLIHDTEPDFYVLELSSFQLELVHSLNARAAVILNVTEDHLDRHPSLQDYFIAKQRIYQGDGIMVINRDDELVCGLSNPARKSIGFTLKKPDAGEFGIRNIDGDDWLLHGSEKLMPESELRIRGKHNTANALAALALGCALDLPMVSMLATLREFTGLPHRCQWVTRHRFVDWYNDSKGTNIGACIASVTGLGGKGNVVLIAGGMGKGADFSMLSGIAKDKLRAAILMGTDGPRMKTILEKIIPVHMVNDMAMAVRIAADIARPGDVVLLSPACASFDMFEDYKARGKAFTEETMKLSG